MRQHRLVCIKEAQCKMTIVVSIETRRRRAITLGTVKYMLVYEYTGMSGNRGGTHTMLPQDGRSSIDLALCGSSNAYAWKTGVLTKARRYTTPLVLTGSSRTGNGWRSFRATFGSLPLVPFNYLLSSAGFWVLRMADSRSAFLEPG